MELQEDEEEKWGPETPEYFGDSTLLNLHGIEKKCNLFILYWVFISCYFEV